MATLVTGGAGFVGSNIVKGLAEAGHRVVCFDLTPADALLTDYLKPWAQNVTFVQGDILNVKDLEQAAAFQAIDKVVHAAVFTPAQRGSMETGTEPRHREHQYRRHRESAGPGHRLQT